MELVDIPITVSNDMLAKLTAISDMTGVPVGQVASVLFVLQNQLPTPVTTEKPHDK